MRLEFQQTLEDFREAQKMHSMAATRPTAAIKGGAIAWQVGGTALTLILTVIYNPWKPANDTLEWLMVRLITPTTPWFFVLGYVLWFQFRSAQAQSTAPAPWTRGGSANFNSVKRPRISKTLRSGIINLLTSVVMIGFGVYQHWMDASNTGSVFCLGWGIGILPWGMSLLFAAALNKGLVERQIQISWDRQAHLHEINIFEFDHAQVIQETPHARSQFSWLSFGGLVETPNLFLLYRSQLMFYIIPKRAFASPDELAAFRNMVTTLAGKQPSGFPVIPLTEQASPLPGAGDPMTME